MTQSSLFDHSCAFFCCQAAQAAGADGGAGKAVRPWITLKIRLGRGEASCAPAAPGQIEVAQSRRHFDLRRCSAGCSGIMTSPSPQRYLMQLWRCGLSVHTVHAQTLDTGMEGLFCWWLKDGGQVIPMFCVRLMKLFRTLTQGSHILVFNANSCFYSCDVFLSHLHVLTPNSSNKGSVIAQRQIQRHMMAFGLSNIGSWVGLGKDHNRLN